MATEKTKKEYRKPTVTRIRLDAKCAVLGFCKGPSSGGPVVSGCEDGFGSNCLDSGS